MSIKQWFRDKFITASRAVARKELDWEWKRIKAEYDDQVKKLLANHTIVQIHHDEKASKELVAKLKELDNAYFEAEAEYKRQLRKIG